MDVQTLYYGSDMLLEVSGLKDQANGAWINDATVAVTLEDSADNLVVGESWPLALTYVTGSDGVYRAILRDTLTLAINARYVATVTADDGEGRRARWDLDFVCKLRRE